MGDRRWEIEGSKDLRMYMTGIYGFGVAVKVINRFY